MIVEFDIVIEHIDLEEKKAAEISGIDYKADERLSKLSIDMDNVQSFFESR